MENMKTFNDVFSKVKIEEDVHRIVKDARVANVKLNREKRSIVIDLILDKIVHGSVFDKLKKQILKDLPGIVDIAFRTKYNFDSSLEMKNIMNLYWDNIMHSIGTTSPIAKTILNNARWELKGNLLEIEVNSDNHCYLDYKKLDKEIETLLSNELGFKVKVTFTGNVEKCFNKEDYEKARDEAELNYVKSMNVGIPSPSAPKTSSGEEGEKVITDKILGKEIKEPAIDINEIVMEDTGVVIEGVAISADARAIKGERHIVSIDMTDFTNSVTVKFFIKDKKWEEIKGEVKKGNWYKIKGNVQYDQYAKELVMMTRDITKIESKATEKKDEAEVKRVELHVHTKMSEMDAVNTASDLIKRARKWGHKAIAITDHGCVQSFPDASHEVEPDDEEFKVIYGVEAYLVDDLASIVQSSHNQDLIDDTYIVFDIETTGFNPGKDKITEIGAVKISGGEIVDRYSTFVNPEMPIPKFITELTGITDEMVANERLISEVLPDFMEFAGDGVLVAHNADFDIKFMRYFANEIDMEINNTVLDTVGLARTLFPGIKNHKLNTIAEYLEVSLDNHHRAVDDAEATAEIFKKCIIMLKEEKDVHTLDGVNLLGANKDAIRKKQARHAIILVKNQVGMKNLYQLVSKSHIEYFYRRPRIPKSELLKHREGLILGSACEAGELYTALLENKPKRFVYDIVDFYDYLEIQPLGNNEFLVRENKVESEEVLKDINREIVALGEKFNKPVVATCDVHFMDPEDEVYRRIIMAGKGFKDADNQPPLYFRTTNEMLAEFDYLGKEKAYEVVVGNTNLVSDMIEPGIRAISPDKCPPKIEGAEEEFREMTYNKARSIYGDNLPQIVEERLENEVESIISNGYAVMYIIAQKLVTKSVAEGYLVGSRGSVGSSFAATMADITEVNPLPPHYICPDCKFSDFDSDIPKSFAGMSGCDMPDKDCPKCGAKLIKEGHDIPFETFLGFGGNKEPDIDLNFSGEYQSKAHDYTGELFGPGKTFRAGTIGTLADKTAYGYVKKYFDEREKVVRNAEINRLLQGCVGIKRSTGQHPGGIIVVPDDKEIDDFCPINWPANDNSVELPTTHFDYHSIDYNLLKLDILGHDDPTMIRRLEDLTGVVATEIPLDEPKVMSLFKGPEALGITSQDIAGCPTGSLGVPELGTEFVIQMLVDTKPEHFSDLVRISGLSHGTDVWLNNAQELVRAGTCGIGEVISTRDDIMTYLINQGMEKKLSFTTMESVRKGKGLKPEMEEAMKEAGVPDWYIWSCKQIKYMFPKAHAVAYVMMAYRIAYFKVYYPAAYYACYFGIRAKAFDYSLMCMGKNALEESQRYIMEKEDKAAKDKDVLSDIKVVREMYARGLNFEQIDLYKAKANDFLVIDDKTVMPSLSSIQGLGEKAAEQVVKAREDGEFISIEDFRNRTKVSKTVIELLKEIGILKGLPETSQLTLF
ncbi:MAG: PolC-type DNA polymerase III [Clostridia bacterium]|jgi:DNA polymerase-3 subunit alpha (Gram-positive type)|nr:PolC-type DNA polymerase III [Clostridia bacterium]